MSWKFGRGPSVAHISVENMEVLRLFIVTAASIGAILTTIFSLLNGILNVYPFHYILPIILVVYFYPDRGVLFSLGLGLMYISLIYLLGNTDPIMIAIASAWFAIFITIGVVASSYAIRLREKRTWVRDILNNSQDGIFCFDLKNLQIQEINAKCARWLKYDRADLIGKEISVIWTDTDTREQFIKGVKQDPEHEQKHAEHEAIFHAQDGTVSRFIISAMLVTRGQALCSVMDITRSKIVDEEILNTLDDLEKQVKERTTDLERMNEKLRAEILACRRFESTFLCEYPLLPKREEL
ncbi:MAG TPA: PAS domain S-box protein [Methanoregula sp.]|nr:PAS domain S-box protein [Methanoregula sp.]